LIFSIKNWKYNLLDFLNINQSEDDEFDEEVDELSLSELVRSLLLFLFFGSPLFSLLFSSFFGL